MQLAKLSFFIDMNVNLHMDGVAAYMNYSIRVVRNLTFLFLFLTESAWAHGGAVVNTFLLNFWIIFGVDIFVLLFAFVRFKFNVAAIQFISFVCAFFIYGLVTFTLFKSEVIGPFFYVKSYFSLIFLPILMTYIFARKFINRKKN